MNTILGIVLPVLGYLSGSLASAIYVSRMMKLPDPRRHGSGNPGATNVLRLGGKNAAALTLTGDVLKGAIPVMLAHLLSDSPAIQAATAVATGLMGLSSAEGGFLASLGHIAWSIVVGGVIGALIHAYLRYVGAEILLFLVGLIYAATYLGHLRHLELALVFIVAGFVTANFSGSMSIFQGFDLGYRPSGEAAERSQGFACVEFAMSGTSTGSGSETV